MKHHFLFVLLVIFIYPMWGYAQQPPKQLKPTARIWLFSETKFLGKKYEINKGSIDDINNLSKEWDNWNNKKFSLIVWHGKWHLYSDINLKGIEKVISPNWYNDPAAAGIEKVSSLFWITEQVGQEQLKQTFPYLVEELPKVSPDKLPPIRTQLVEIGKKAKNDNDPIINLMIRSIQDYSDYQIRLTLAKVLEELGKTKYLCDKVRNPDSPEVLQSGAKQALILIGSSAISDILQSFKNEDNVNKTEASNIIAKMQAPLPEVLKFVNNPDALMRRLAIQTIGKLGNDAKDMKTIEALQKALDDDYGVVRGEAIKALGEIALYLDRRRDEKKSKDEKLLEERVLYTLVKALSDDEGTARVFVLNGLLNWKERPAITLANNIFSSVASRETLLIEFVRRAKEFKWEADGLKLFASWNHSDPQIRADNRFFILLLLGEVTPSWFVPLAVYMCADVLQDPEEKWYVKLAAARVLAHIRPVSYDVEKTWKFFAEKMPELLKGIVPMPPEQLRCFVDEKKLSTEIIQHFKAHGDFNAAISTLCTKLPVPIPNFADITEKIIEPIRPIIPYLERLAKEEISNMHPIAADVLKSSLKSKDWSVRAWAAEALGAMRAQEAVQDLIVGLKDEEWTVKALSAEALGWILGDMKEKPSSDIKELSQSLSDDDPSVRRAVAEAFRYIALKDTTVEAELRDSLKRESDSTVKRSLISALGFIGQEASSVDALTQFVDATDDYFLKKKAVIALGRIGRNDNNAVTSLRKCLNQKDPQIRAYAAWALVKMLNFPDASNDPIKMENCNGASDDLIKIVQDSGDDLDVRAVVAAALSRANLKNTLAAINGELSKEEGPGSQTSKQLKRLQFALKLALKDQTADLASQIWLSDPPAGFKWDLEFKETTLNEIITALDKGGIPSDELRLAFENYGEFILQEKSIPIIPDSLLQVKRKI